MLILGLMLTGYDESLGKSFHILNARKFFGRFIETKVNVLLGCNFSIDIFMSRVGIKPIADSAYEDRLLRYPSSESLLIKPWQFSTSSSS